MIFKACVLFLFFYQTPHVKSIQEKEAESYIKHRSQTGPNSPISSLETNYSLIWAEIVQRDYRSV